MRTAFMLIITIALSGFTGCSSDNPDLEPTPKPTIKSFFIPITPPLSPRDEGGIIADESPLFQRDTALSRAMSPNGPTPEPIAMNKWFYLVNGVGANDINSGNMPNTLTVSGPAPNGAPNPNGGTTVSVETFNPDNTGKSLWKAVSSPDEGVFYLQSATSFKVNTNTSYPFPNLLVGYGATFAPLVLGYLPNWSPTVCLSWNQEESPTGDQSDFQKWYYDTDTAQLWYFKDDNQSLYNDAGAALVSNGSSAPYNQWYTYPNYYLSQIAAQPASDPAFPGFPLAEETYGNCSITSEGDAGGQQKAYQWISNQCFPGVNDVRSEYTNLSQSAALQSCATLCKTYYGNPKVHNPDPTGNSLEPIGVPITDDDFSAVACQLSNECQWAGSIQATFSIYNKVLNSILFADSTTLPKLGNDLNLSQNQSVNVVAMDIIEGMLHTVMCATGDPALGVFANLMEMGVSSVSAAGGSAAQQLTQTIKTTVANLYSDLGSAMTALTLAGSNGENLILEDWGRLKKAGPLTEITGYNGLGITSSSEATIEKNARKGYIVSVMQQLLPLAYGLSLNAAVQSDTFSSVPSYAQSSFSTFGSDTSNVNTGYIYSENTVGGQEYPSSTVMEDDILNNGANPFELYNGINGWAGIPLGTQVSEYPHAYSNLGCAGSVLTLFNASALDLYVSVSPSQGMIAAPGYTYNSSPDNWGISHDPSGSESGASFELRPYGYLPVWVTANGWDDENLTVNIDITDAQSGAWYCSFTFGGDGCHGKVPTYQWDEAYQSGWNGDFYSRQGYMDGLWMTLYQTN